MSPRPSASTSPASASVWPNRSLALLAAWIVWRRTPVLPEYRKTRPAPPRTAGMPMGAPTARSRVPSPSVSPMLRTRDPKEMAPGDPIAYSSEPSAPE